jgi:hypothetical protein
MSTTPMQQAQITAYQQPVDEVLTTLDTDSCKLCAMAA